MAPLTADLRRALAPTAAVAGVLLAFFLTQYAGAVAIPFINDDYVFLDKTRAAGFLDLWRFEGLAFHWYRPWSRELHYWTLQRLFGARETAFHLANVALWLAVLTGFWSLTRRLAGSRAAAVAVAGMAAMAAWAVPVLWVAGVQDLWMLLFALLTLHAWVAGRPWLAAVALAGALLSKETAAVVAPLAIACSLVVERRRPAVTLWRALPLIVATALWALVHPLLGGRLWHAPVAPAGSAPGPGLLALLRTLLVPLNLDALPRPEHGWLPILGPGAAGAMILGAAVVLGSRARERSPTAAPRPVIAFGIVWALLGWAPLLMPSLGWHAYYSLLGACGVWLALAPLLARRTALAAVLVATLALLGTARAATPSLDWGTAWYQRRAAAFIRVMRAQLKERHPTLPAHSRLFFVRIPSNVGLLAGDGPALRVWYDDPTLRAGFYSAYRPRDPAGPAGPDLFFRFDSTGGWVELVPGAEDAERARHENPRWEKDHATLAATLARAGDWRGAAIEYEKLADVAPDRLEFAFDAGMSRETLGDSAAAAAWYARAAALPDADAEVREAAARLARHLRGSR